MEDVLNCFSKQLIKNKPLEDEMIQNFKIKEYFNGEKMKMGQVPLFAFVEKEDYKSELIILRINHIKFFDVIDPFFRRGLGIPKLKLKKSENQDLKL